MSSRKPGVSSPEELAKFVADAGDKLLVVDVRNSTKDASTLALAPLPAPGIRPGAVSLMWDADTASMPLPEVPRDTPIITHCGSGGRGQKAKEFLISKGFTKVLNGGGPGDSECFKTYSCDVLKVERKATVSSPEELEAFIAEAGDNLIIIDVRGPTKDQESPKSNTPRKLDLEWSNETKSMPLPSVPREAPILVHCQSGRRAEMAINFLRYNGYSNTINGGGPSTPECWEIYSS